MFIFRYKHHFQRPHQLLQGTLPPFTDKPSNNIGYKAGGPKLDQFWPFPVVDETINTAYTIFLEARKLMAQWRKARDANEEPPAAVQAELEQLVLDEVRAAGQRADALFRGTAK